MRKIYFLFVAFLLAGSVTLSAQGDDPVNYLDEVFGVGEPTLMAYGRNYSLIGPLGVPDTVPLPMDVWQPTGETDTERLRPVFVMFHTGNFLPQYFNGGPYGNRRDSVNVELVSRFVKRGFVGISADYRLGWQPTAADPSIRTGSLLQAVYRASQDAHALARYLRRTVAEQGNPLRIDTSRIVFMGAGSGGYLVNAHAFLDNIDQIAANEQFYDSDFNLLVNEDVISNPDGTEPAIQHIVNHPGYSSEVALTVNLAGALGDTLWMDGDENPHISIHSATDPFAPYYRGTVIVPVEEQFRVVDVQGSRLVAELANDYGINDPLIPANALPLPGQFSQLSNVVNGIIAAYSTIPFQSPIPTNTTDIFPLGEQNLWTVLRRPPNVGLSGATTGVWNWFNETALRAQVAAVNQMNPTAMLDADAIVSGEDQTNPNRNNPAAAKANIDTIMAFVLPRMYYALDIDALLSTEDLLTPNSVGLTAAPNPARDGVLLTTDEGHPIREVALFDLQGRLLRHQRGVDLNRYRLERGDLPEGTYIVQLRLDNGVTATKVMFR